METSTIILLALFGLLFGGALVLFIIGRRRESKKLAEIRADSEAARDNSIELDYHQTYNIAGVNMRGLDPLWDCGAFHGYVIREPDNRYDRHAVAVVKGNLQHVGYLRADDATYLSKDLDKIGGRCPCLLEIQNTLDDSGRRFFVGHVQILWPNT